jgi:membrane-associated phospholipid phosphatase
LLIAAAFASFVAVLLPSAIGMHVDVMSFVPAFVFVPSAAVLWLWATWRRRARARAIAEVVVVPLLLSLPVLVFSYAAMRTALPLQDARLETWDAALGFRALDFIGWINSHPTFSFILSRCYSSFFPQLLLLPIILVACGRAQRAYEMTFVILLLGILGASICMFFPAEGVYVHHQIADGAFANVPQSLGYFHVQLDAVRNDPNFVLDVGRAEGIVAFPSGHAAVAVMCAWAAWPLRWIRWPILIINVGMFVSAIPQGAHYLVDLIAGAAMATLSILIATRLPHALAARKA